jgi:hypothetical protein
VSERYDDALERTISSLSGAFHAIDRVYVIAPNPPPAAFGEYMNPKFVFLTDSGVGTYEAMNTILFQDNLEDYLLFLNSGDELHSNIYFDRCREKIYLNPDTIAIVSGHINKYPASNVRIIKWFFGERHVGPSLKAKKIKQCSFLFKSNAFQKINGFNTSYRIAADYDFFIRVLALKHHQTLNMPSSVFYLDGISSQSRLASLKDQKLVDDSYNHSPSVRKMFIFTNYIVRSIRAIFIDKIT